MEILKVHPHGMKAAEGKDWMLINTAHIVSMMPNADGTLRIALDKTDPVCYPTGVLSVKETIDTIRRPWEVLG